MNSFDPAAVAQQLRERIKQIETPYAALRRSAPTGFEALDRLLPDGGLMRGTLVEWLADHEGNGAAALALTVAGRILRHESILVVIDHAGVFYPPAAAELGIPLERTVVVRPDAPSKAWWSWEQSLRCPGVAVTFGWLDSLSERVFHRLRLGAQAGGGLGFLLRSGDCESTASWGTTRLNVQPLPGKGSGLGRRLRVGLLRSRGGPREAVVELELDHETGDVPAVSGMAPPAPLFALSGR